MTTPGRLTLWDWLRSNLRDHDTSDTLTRLETAMATAAEQLNTLSTKVDDLVSDVRAALDILRSERDNFSPDAQTAFDQLDQKVAAFDAEIGDADGSDTPATPEEPTEPGTDTFR
ncbi:hypothetical protein [Micromonospora tulbaghiae]|uniref:hypothetical protein n=1 Tax=Micromonospora tulbaghiae TaxID=479978 RepID=UPI003406DADC